MVLLHPVNRLSTRYITSMASLLLSYRSSQEAKDTLYTGVLVTDHYLAEMTSSYQTTLRAIEFLAPPVARLMPSPQGILCRVHPVDFMQEG